MNNLVPTKVFLTKGVGKHKYQLKSFETALRQAGVAQQNLVQVSSILPPKCKFISREKGIKLLTPGTISFCVMARSDTNEHGRLVASSIGVAVPRDEDKWGYLSEVHGHGMNNQQASDMAEDFSRDDLCGDAWGNHCRDQRYRHCPVGYSRQGTRFANLPAPGWSSA